MGLWVSEMQHLEFLLSLRVSYNYSTGIIVFTFFYIYIYICYLHFFPPKTTRRHFKHNLNLFYSLYIYYQYYYYTVVLPLGYLWPFVPQVPHQQNGMVMVWAFLRLL